MGFVKWGTQLAARDLLWSSLRALAVSAMMGVGFRWCSRSHARIVAVAIRPSITGIWHLNVHQYQIIASILKLLEGDRAIFSFLNDIGHVFKEDTHDGTVIFQVFGKQDAERSEDGLLLIRDPCGGGRGWCLL